MGQPRISLPSKGVQPLFVAIHSRRMVRIALGYDADVALVDLKARRTIRRE